MSMGDYEKGGKDEKDSRIVEVGVRRDGRGDLGYGIGYSRVNRDRLWNGKGGGVWG